jgi:hypothetical protein
MRKSGSPRKSETSPPTHDPHAIAAEAFAVIAATMPLNTVGYERERTATGGYFIWVECAAADKLFAEQRCGEDISDAILRLGYGG